MTNCNIPPLDSVAQLPPVLDNSYFWKVIPKDCPLPPFSLIGVDPTEFVPNFIGLPTDIYDPCLWTSFINDVAPNLPAHTMPQNTDGTWNMWNVWNSVAKQDPSTEKWVVEGGNNYNLEHLNDYLQAQDRPMTLDEANYYSRTRNGPLNDPFRNKPYEYYMACTEEKLKFWMVRQDGVRHEEWLNECHRRQISDYNYQRHFDTHDTPNHVKLYWLGEERLRRMRWNQHYKNKWFTSRRNIFEELRILNRTKKLWSDRHMDNFWKWKKPGP